MSEQEYKKGEMIPVKDIRGNNLHIGSEIAFFGHMNQKFIQGIVIGFEPGGVEVNLDINSKEKRQTPPRVILQFQWTLLCDPRMMILAEVLRTINPNNEVVLEKALTKGKAS